MSEYEIAKTLTNFPRSYEAIAVSLMQAAKLEVGTCRVCRVDLDHKPLECPHCGSIFDESTWIGRDVDHTDRAGYFTRRLVDNYMLIDQLALADVFMAIVGYLAQRTGRTPRQIHEDYFAQAPEDGWWRERIEGGDQ